MEISLLESTGVVPNAIISIRAGTTRRQVPVSFDQPLRFPTLPLNASSLKIDVLLPVGAAKVAVGAADCDYNVSIPSIDGAESMGLKFAVKGAPDLCGKSGSELKITSPMSQTAPAAPDGTRQSPLHAALDARSYMDEHDILMCVQEMLKDVIQEKPKDPYMFMSRYLAQRGENEEAVASAKSAGTESGLSAADPAGCQELAGDESRQLKVGSGRLLHQGAAEIDGTMYLISINQNQVSEDVVDIIALNTDSNDETSLCASLGEIIRTVGACGNLSDKCLSTAQLDCVVQNVQLRDGVLALGPGNLHTAQVAELACTAGTILAGACIDGRLSKAVADQLSLRPAAMQSKESDAIQSSDFRSVQEPEATPPSDFAKELLGKELSTVAAEMPSEAPRETQPSEDFQVFDVARGLLTAGLENGELEKILNSMPQGGSPQNVKPPSTPPPRTPPPRPSSGRRLKEETPKDEQKDPMPKQKPSALEGSIHQASQAGDTSQALAPLNADYEEVCLQNDKLKSERETLLKELELMRAEASRDDAQQAPASSVDHQETARGEARPLEAPEQAPMESAKSVEPALEEDFNDEALKTLEQENIKLRLENQQLLLGLSEMQSRRCRASQDLTASAVEGAILGLLPELA